MARPRPYLHTTSPRLTGAGGLPSFDAKARPLIRLQTLGAAVVMVGELRLSAAAGTLFSLLVRLTGAPGMMLGRDVLRRSLWPEQEPVRQRANLRQALYKLRGFGVSVSMQGDAVFLDETQVVRSFSRERSAATFERDVTLGHEPFGPYLPGFAVPWPEYQEWLDVQREAIHADVRRVLVEQLRQRRDRADWGGADALARWLLQFDPLNEEATLTIAECTALSGSKREALAILDRYLAELGPTAGDIRLPATMLRKRIAEPASRRRLSFASTERHFVGRDDELAMLTLAMRRARWHDGSAVLLHGPSGIGKSRLAHELDKVATIEGMRVVQTSCRESDLLRPLSVFLDLLPELMSHSGALGCAPESLAALRRLVPSDRANRGSDGSSSAPASPTESSGGAPDALAPTLAPREPMPMASSLRRAIIDLLAAVSDEKVMLLIVEDVHWIDEHSWDVLADLIDRVGAMRVFLLVTSRESHARPHRPQRVPLSLRVLAIPPLSADSCLLLSRAIGEDLSAPVSDELGEWFVRASEGSPLFLRALVNHWIETGEAGGVPPTLQGVIEQRLSQLSGDALRVLQTAALLGKLATCERVTRVLELRANEMLLCLEQLETLGAVAPSASISIRAHELVAQTSRSKLSPLARTAVHLRVAAILGEEARGMQDTELLLASLDHLQLAGEPQRLLSATLSSLDKIVEFGVPGIGLAAVRRAQGLRVSAADRARLSSATARLLLDAGEYSLAISDPLKGLLLPDISTRPSDMVLDTALSLVNSAYRADPLVDRDALTRFTVLVSELSYPARQTRLRAADIGLILASDACDATFANRIYTSLEISNSEIEQSDTCRRVAILYHTLFGSSERARQLAETLFERAANSPPTSAAFHDALRSGFALRIVAGGRTHLDSLELAFRIAEEVATPLHSLSAAWLLAQSYLELDDQSGFVLWNSHVRRLFVEIGDQVVCNFAVGLFCRVAIERGDESEARAHFETFAKNLPRMPALKLSSYALCLKVGVGLLDEKWLPTEDMLKSLLERQAKIARYGTSDFLTSVGIEALDRVGDRARAVELLDTYLFTQRREVGPLGARLARTAKSISIKH